MQNRQHGSTGVQRSGVWGFGGAGHIAGHTASPSEGI